MKKTPYRLFQMRKRKLQLDSVPGLKGQYRYLRREEFFADFAAIRRQFFVACMAEPSTEVDISTWDSERIRAQLQGLSVPSDLETHVIWCGDEDGAVLPYGFFVAAFGDLWFPSQDVIWVTPSTHEWLLEMDNEEVLRFWRRQ